MLSPPGSISRCDETYRIEPQQLQLQLFEAAADFGVM